jgi:hypothetical protein
MKYISLTTVVLLILSGNALAITGLGIGVRGGYVHGLDLGPIDEWTKSVIPDADTDDHMPMIGVHLKINTLPMLKLEAALEYAWKEMEIYMDSKLKVSNLGITGTAFYNIFPAPVITPYVGIGAGMYTMTYTYDQGADAPAVTFPVDNETKLGFHGVAGVRLHPPMFPLEFFARYRYTYISTKEEPTKYSTILAGATFNLP